MTVDYEIQSLWEWLLPSLGKAGALLEFTFMLAVVCLIGVLIGYLGSAMRHGFNEGFYRLAMVVVNAPFDFFNISFGRISAVARLAVQEAIRRRILIVFGIFVLFLLIAGWYLDQKSDRPAEIYLTFVLTSTNFLIVLMSLFISAFSLPNDIKSRTIYTIVTKPVLASEVVVGRILGFAIVGTAMLVMMGAISYIFVVRGLSHSHEVAIERVEKGKGELSGNLVGETTPSNHHTHKFTLNEENGIGETEMVMQHSHVVEKNGEEFTMGPAEGLPPLGRVPTYGKLRFLNRAGAEGEGINVGYEWTYRSYIEGGTLAAAIWTFDNVTEANYTPRGIPLELNLSVFRTHKGDITQGVLGEIIIQNPDPAARVRRSTPITFSVKEYEVDKQFIPRKLSAISIDDSQPIEVDLFDDLAPDGKLEIIIRCAERAQYFGMAQADVYIKANETPFLINFFKAYVGIWLQMVIVISLGVTFSTFVSGPVAMMATISSIAMGVFARFIAGVFGEQFESNPFLSRLFGTVPDKGDGVLGGGPIESLIRVVTQNNVSVDLDFHPWILASMKWIDLFLMGVLYTFTRVLPNFRELNRADNVAHGFDISLGLLSQDGLMTLSYFMILAITGYFFLKTREIAA